MARGMLGVPPPKPPMMAEPPPEPTKVGILLNALISLLALTALFAGIVRVTFNLEPPADRARVEKLTAALTGPNSPQSDVQGLRINDIKATLYPQPAGTNILVIHGKLSSSRVDLVDNVHVTTTLVTPEGKELSSISGPVGLTFSPYELAHFNQDLSMATILESRVGEPIGDVPPQTTTSWMVIAESPSVDASTLSYRVVLKEQEPPAPSSVGQPAPSVQKGEAVDVDTGLPDESGQEPAQ